MSQAVPYHLLLKGARPVAAGGHCQGRSVSNGPALVSHHPVRNSERSTRQERLRASARCSLGVERGGWGCRMDLRNWGGVTPTWRPHTGSAGAHLQIRSEFGFFAGLKPVTSVQRHESPRFFGNRHHCTVGRGCVWAGPIIKSMPHPFSIERTDAGVGRLPRAARHVMLGLRP